MMLEMKVRPVWDYKVCLIVLLVTKKQFFMLLCSLHGGVEKNNRRGFRMETYF
jgi:hypothetical protein